MQTSTGDAMDTAKTPAKPRVQPLKYGALVSYRGITVRIEPVHDGRDRERIAWWSLRESADEDAREAHRGDTPEEALRRWVRVLDEKAEIERAKARKPGKPETLKVTRDLSVTVIPNESIRVHGTSVDLTYRIGDRAVHHFGNRYYTGVVIGITSKMVVIRENARRTRRLPFHAFAGLNDRPMSHVAQHNADWSD